jgi:acetyl esterase/lipase
MKKITFHKDQQVWLDCYIPQSDASPAVIICPGGGYQTIAPREGEVVAQKFVELGCRAFVLHYTTQGEPLGFRPLKDLCWAISLLYKEGTALGVLPEQIFLCGFSAGGHLAASFGVYWKDPSFWGEDTPHPVAGLVLCYPVITAGPHAHNNSMFRLAGEHSTSKQRRPFSLEHGVGPHVPPCFLWHTQEDDSVPVENSMLFAATLLRYHIPVELHIFPFGCHGLSLATPATEEILPHKHRVADPHIAHWPQLCREWMDNIIQKQEKRQ